MRTVELRLATFTAAVYAVSLFLRITVVDEQAKARDELRIDRDYLRSPGPAVLKAASFGHALAMADLMWLAVVQELGKSAPPKSGAWDRVERWTDIATDLDPKYFQPYHTSAIQLALFGQEVEASDRLLHKGEAALPEEWQFPFVLGFNAYFIRGDAALAAAYMTQAAALPGAPSYLPALSGRMKFQSGDSQGAILLLEAMIPTLEGRARTNAEERLAMLRSETILERYDQACRRFREENGRDPENATALRAWAKLDVAPADLLGHPIELDKDCIARTSIIQVREFEAQKRIGSVEKREQGQPLR